VFAIRCRHRLCYLTDEQKYGGDPMNSTSESLLLRLKTPDDQQAWSHPPVHFSSLENGLPPSLGDPILVEQNGQISLPLINTSNGNPESHDSPDGATDLGHVSDFDIGHSH